ncbi:2-iminobutanoate/2-iminopropanoate deaminase [Pelagirhabdus alkalitolerans]|uniref:2-iminobutanoate/2-iminopropanoate deaminase n=1 Tax=Pelagirhabdus alkalitolerans TaxID=1612202 RepID=A0A1G6GJU3_9BACI|nr:RidA family protein [Pelagirhabdus alkalitolerans]SDB82271.1 2-iminobutanoate/2-iminopropanoate deaminase [Pelagirhabdus alkalitolerans]
MTMKKVQTNQAPEAIGPYSQAIDTGDLVFVSGQIPLIPETMKLVDGDIKEQTLQVMNNLRAVLKEADLTFDDVIKFTIYLTDMNNFSILNETYAEFLKEPYPARATVEVSQLPKGAEVEMDVIAKRSS